MNEQTKRWYPLALVLAACAASLAVFDRLPDPMAVHWDIAGNPNGWMPRAAGAFISPGMMLIAWFSLRAAPLLDPRRANYERFTAAYELSVATLLVLVFVVHLVLLAIALGYPVPVNRLAPALIGAVFIIIGNVIPRARSNFMFGIRTPWTLSSDRVWARTHRLAGYTMTLAGGVMVLSALLTSAGLLGAIVVSAVVSALVAPAIYSYFTFRRAPMTSREPLQERSALTSRQDPYRTPTCRASRSSSSSGVRERSDAIQSWFPCTSGLGGVSPCGSLAWARTRRR
jgi:uncharacterized membrane protein